MKFNIIEGGDSPEFIEEFIKLYNNKDLKVRDIAKKLDISLSRYQTLKKNLVEDGRIDPDLRKVKPLFVTYNKADERWRVQRTVKNKTTQYLSFKYKDNALRAVELFHEYGWDKKNNERIFHEVMDL